MRAVVLLADASAVSCIAATDAAAGSKVAGKGAASAASLSTTAVISAVSNFLTPAATLNDAMVFSNSVTMRVPVALTPSPTAMAPSRPLLPTAFALSKLILPA